MRPVAKILFLICISLLALGYGFAQKPFLSGEKSQPPKPQYNIGSIIPQKSGAKIQQKSGTKLPCELETGFVTKIARIRDNCLQKITLLVRVNASLQEILPLVKDSTIKSNLQAKQEAVALMIKNYTVLRAALEKNPRSACGQKTPLRKTYNEETKVLVDVISEHLRLLKK